MVFTVVMHDEPEEEDKESNSGGSVWGSGGGSEEEMVLTAAEMGLLKLTPFISESNSYGLLKPSITLPSLSRHWSLSYFTDGCCRSLIQSSSCTKVSG